MTERGRPRAVVIGLGDTGVLVAMRLARRFDVVGISARPALVSGQELGNRLARPDHWRRNFLVPLDRYRGLDAVTVLHGLASSVDTERREVHVDLADGGSRVESYDVLVVASGVTNGFWRHGRLETEDDIERNLRGVAVELDAAGTVAVVGGGATGVSVAGNLAARHPDKEIHLFHGGDEPLPGYHPRTRVQVVEELRRSGVHVHPGHRARIEGVNTDELTTAPVEWTTGQDPFDADVVVWAVGRVRPNTAFLPDAMLDDDGFVRVDEHLRSLVHPDVLAIGDVAATDPHRSSARNWGYRVAVRNAAVAGGVGRGRLARFRAPRNRWGSVLGVQDDGMLVFRPDGRGFRVPHRLVQPLLFDAWTHTVMYRGVRRRSRR